MPGARLSVFEPRSFEINAIFEVIIVTVAVIPIVHPFSFVYISITVDQASGAISHVRSPQAFVQRTIIAELNTKTVSFLSLFINKADVITFIILDIPEFHQTQFNIRYLYCIYVTNIYQKTAFILIKSNPLICTAFFNRLAHLL